MAFSKPVPGDLFGSPHKLLYVAAAVIPMGWVSAVSLFQHLTRQLSLLPRYSGAQLNPLQEWRRDARLPLRIHAEHQEWFQHYLDDFDAPCLVQKDNAHAALGVPSPILQERRLACAAHNIAWSKEKAIEGQVVVERMGALVDGDLGTVGVQPTKVLQLIHFGLHVCSCELCHCKKLAIFF